MSRLSVVVEWAGRRIELAGYGRRGTLRLGRRMIAHLEDVEPGLRGLVFHRRRAARDREAR